MLLYAIVMFLVAALFAVFAVLIYGGKTDLIHDYHQTKVTDKAAYAKAFGKALGMMSGAMAVSGAVAFWGLVCAVVVLIVGMAVGIAAICRVQKKYNGGVF